MTKAASSHKETKERTARLMWVQYYVQPRRSKDLQTLCGPDVCQRFHQEDNGATHIVIGEGSEQITGIYAEV